jgi:hypothetical protein
MARSSLIITAAAFAVGAIAATAVSLFALSSIGTGLGQTQTLGGAPVPTASASAPSVPASESTAVPTGTGSTASADAAGGLVAATCRNGGAYLVSWSPKPGFRVEHLVRGPAPTASIKFEGLAGESSVTVRCANDVPVINVFEDNHTSGHDN